MSLHPQATYPIPEETQRVARAAFPRGNIYMQVADRLGTSTTTRSSRRFSPGAANPPKRRHVWRWPRSSSLQKACPIAKPRRPSAAVSIGNMSWGWN